MDDRGEGERKEGAGEEGNEVEVEEEAGGDGGSEEEPYPLSVIYCGVCGLPPEYCEYGSTADECRAWAEAHCPELFAVEARMAALEVKDGGDGDGREGGGGKGGPKKKGKKVKIAKPGGKKGPGSVEQRIVIGRLSRNKRKFVTVVDGLDTFPDVKIKDAAKRIGRQFACGSSVSKAPSGAEEVVIQGDVLLDLPEFLEINFNIPASKITVLPT